MIDFQKYAAPIAPVKPTIPGTQPVGNASLPAPTSAPVVSQTPTEQPAVSKFAKYGTPVSAPVAKPVEEPKKSTLGTLLGPAKEGVEGLKTLYGGGDQGIAKKLADDVSEAAKDYNGPMGVKQLLAPTKAALRTAGDVAGTVFAPVGALIGATGVGKLFDKIGELSQNKGGIIDKITDIPAVQDYVIRHPNTGEDFGRALNLVLAEGEKGKIDPKTVIERTAEQAKTAVEKVKTKLPSQEKTNAKIIDKRASDLKTLDDNYVQLRKASGYSEDNGQASRKRIASTDVLVDSVDDTGTIRTKQPGGAVEQYKAQTLDQAEGVVRHNLERLGEKVNLETVEKSLTDAVHKSGLEGSDLTSALEKVKKEIEGYKMKADANGDVPLTLIHDAKINATNGINYFTDPEVKTYRKAVARGLKTVVEDNSKFNVKEVNTELSKFLDDISLLERLDGKKVQGGKLGKYFAQIAGNAAGGIAGGMAGGPVGSAIGTVVGGEVAGRIKGSQLESTFGKKTGAVAPKSPIIQEAIDIGKSPRLALPAPKEGSPRVQISSGKTINLPKSTENTYRPRDNFTNQKTTIPKQNPPKTVMPESVSQVEKNVNVPKKEGFIERFKNTPNKEGGFINLFADLKPKNVSPAEKGTMRDFMDFVAGEYKPSEKTALQLAQDAQDIAKKYGFRTAFSSNKSLSSAFGKFLNSVGFKK